MSRPNATIRHPERQFRGFAKKLKTEMKHKRKSLRDETNPRALKLGLTNEWNYI